MANKSQLVRLADVFLVGPGIIWVSVVARRHVKGDALKAAATLMAVTGGLTIAYNGWNWLDERRKKAAIGELREAQGSPEGLLDLPTVKSTMMLAPPIEKV